MSRVFDEFSLMAVIYAFLMLERIKPYIPVLFAANLELGLQILLIMVQIQENLFWFFTGLFVHGIFLTTIIIFIIRSIHFFKKSFAQEFLNVLILCFVAVIVWFFETQRTRLEFFLFRSQMQAVANLGLQNLLEVKAKQKLTERERTLQWNFDKVKISNRFWWVKNRETLMTSPKMEWIFFQTNTLFSECGFLFSVNGNLPNRLYYSEKSLPLYSYFQKLENDWFYGCFSYD